MKTLNEIKEEVAYSIEGCSWEEYRKNHIISERTLERIAHLFAREALDTAAEMVDFREMTNQEIMDGQLEGIGQDSGIVFTIDKQLILSLKDKLK